MSDDLTRAIAEALGCEKREASFGTFCRKHQYRRWVECEGEAANVAAALAPLIEARAREARAEELDFVAAEFERSANRVEKAKGATERTRFMREMVDVLRNRAREVCDE